jgi:hypothetical protein
MILSPNRASILVRATQDNHAAMEWVKLSDVKLLRTASPSDAMVHAPTLELDCAQLDGAAVREGNSILCTSLSQFDNSVLQTERSMFPNPLLGVGGEDGEEDDDESSSEESDPEPSDELVLGYYAVKYSPARASASDTLPTSSLNLGR